MGIILLRFVYVTIGIIALVVAFVAGRFSMEGALDNFLFFATAMAILLGSLLLAREDGRKLGKG